MRIRAYSLACMLLSSSVLVTAVALPGEAHAQSADAMTEMARQRFQEGVQFYDAKDYEKARAAFLQAYALKKHPSVLLNLAQSELRSGHEADAAQHFDKFLRENPSASAADRQEADKGLAAARVKVAEVAVTAPAGAQIFVDGEPVGAAPLAAPVFLMPGKHKLEARKDGESTALDVTAAAGAKSTETLTFGGSAAAPGGPVTPPPEGGPATQPPAGGEPPADGGFSVSTSEPREPFMDWAKRGPVSWIGGGLFGVGLLTGVILAISSNSSYSEADNVRGRILTEKARLEEMNETVGAPCSASSPRADYFSDACTAWQDNVDAGDTKKTISTVGFVAAGVGAAVVVGGYFLTAKRVEPGTTAKRKPLPPSAIATPVVSEHFKGFALIGQF